MMRFATTLRNLALAVILLAASPASAATLTPAEVKLVVETMRELQIDLGDLAYDDEAAADWFEEDAAGAGHITAAGFDAQSWRAALDRTMHGFYALMSDAEIDAVFEGAQGFETRDGFSEVQKQAMRELVADMRVRIDRWRREGAGDAAVVRPHAEEIRKILDDE